MEEPSWVRRKAHLVCHSPHWLTRLFQGGQKQARNATALPCCLYLPSFNCYSKAFSLGAEGEPVYRSCFESEKLTQPNKVLLCLSTGLVYGPACDTLGPPGLPSTSQTSLRWTQSGSRGTSWPASPAAASTSSPPSGPPRTSQPRRTTSCPPLSTSS